MIKHLDEAMAELDRMDQMISLYKFQLNVSYPSCMTPEMHILADPDLSQYFR